MQRPWKSGIVFSLNMKTFDVTLRLTIDESNNHPSRWPWQSLIDETNCQVIKVEEVECPLDRFSIGTKVNVTWKAGSEFDKNFTGHVTGYRYNKFLINDDTNFEEWEVDESQLKYNSDIA